MKKSEITVSMPMISYEELARYKIEYENLLLKIKGCFNLNNLDEGVIQFDTNAFLLLAKSFLPDRFKNLDFVKIE